MLETCGTKESLSKFLKIHINFRAVTYLKLLLKQKLEFQRPELHSILTLDF